MADSDREHTRMLGRLSKDPNYLRHVETLREPPKPSRESDRMSNELKPDRTQRGFAIARFEDRYDEACSIQDSSLATESCIWLGKDGPEGTDRMHLTQQQVEALLPLLHRFVETGSISA